MIWVNVGKIKHFHLERKVAMMKEKHEKPIIGF
jgi:hypothetical protein